MHTLYLVYSILGILILACMILAALNLISLSSLSSRAVFLEGEIQKKALEFASIRKEFQQARERASVADANALTQEISSVASPETTQIEVVRSVRQGFGDTSVRLEQETIDMAHPVEDSSSIPAESDIARQSEAHPGLGEFTSWKGASAPDVARNQEPSTGFESSAIVISVYSPSKKDTDFHFVWKTLAEKLAASERPRVCLDFRNILFLYEKEIGYLERIRDSIERSNGVLCLVHCEQELRNILGQIPSLASCLAE